MQKKITAALVACCFLFAGAGAALASSYTYTHELVTNLFMTTTPSDLNNGVTDFSYTYNLTEPFTETHPDPDRAYLPYTDIFKSATLALYFSDDEIDEPNNIKDEKFKLGIDASPSGSNTITNNNLSEELHSTSVATVESAFSTDGILTYNLLASNGDFTFIRSVFTVTWEYEDVVGDISSLELTSIDAAAVPEPATMLLLGTGLVGVAGAVRRKKKNQA